MDSNPGGPQPLQFDTAVSHSSPAGVSAQGVTCSACQRTVLDEYFDVNGQSVCATCRTELEQLAETPRGRGLFAKAGGFGLVAAILGAVLYYAVIAITNFEIGIVAIAIGYTVGWAIRRATAGRGARRFQVLALVLTYWSVGLAYMPLALQQTAPEEQHQQAPGSAEAPAPISTSSGSPDGGVLVSLVRPVALLLGLSFVLPVFVVFGSLPGGLISALIIGIGMRQAWQMTGVPALQISGPYRIAAASPTAAV